MRSVATFAGKLEAVPAVCKLFGGRVVYQFGLKLSAHRSDSNGSAQAILSPILGDFPLIARGCREIQSQSKGVTKSSL